MAAEATLLERLANVQQALKVPKAQRNTFGNYNYRNAEDILEAVKPLLATQNLVLTLSDELVQIGERYYIKATAIVHGHDLADPTGSHSITAYAREEETKKGMDGSQITGASSSYARKYALNGLFLIDDTHDSDATNDHSKTKTAPKPVEQPSIERMTELMNEKGYVGTAAIEFCKRTIGKERPTTTGDINRLIEALQK